MHNLVRASTIRLMKNYIHWILSNPCIHYLLSTLMKQYLSKIVSQLFNILQTEPSSVQVSHNFPLFPPILSTIEVLNRLSIPSSDGFLLNRMFYSHFS